MVLLINCIHVVAYNSIISTLAGYWVAKTGDVSIEPKGALQVIKPKGALRVIHRLSRVILVRLRVCISPERFSRASVRAVHCVTRANLRKSCAFH